VIGAVIEVPLPFHRPVADTREILPKADTITLFKVKVKTFANVTSSGSPSWVNAQDPEHGLWTKQTDGKRDESGLNIIPARFKVNDESMTRASKRVDASNGRVAHAG
jgi:hypothetical protein